jgi:hypothetical protein
MQPVQPPVPAPIVCIVVWYQTGCPLISICSLNRTCHSRVLSPSLPHHPQACICCDPATSRSLLLLATPSRYRSAVVCGCTYMLTGVVLLCRLDCTPRLRPCSTGLSHQVYPSGRLHDFRLRFCVVKLCCTFAALEPMAMSPTHRHFQVCLLACFSVLISFADVLCL